MHAIFRSGGFRSLCSDRLCVLICLDNDVMEEAGRGDGAKVLGGWGENSGVSRQPPTAAHCIRTGSALGGLRFSRGCAWM